MKTLLTILTTVLFAATAHAQTDPATAQLQHGVELRAAGNDAGALAEFQAAYGVSHSPLALAQMALAEQALGHWADAEEHLRTALATHDGWIERHRDVLNASYALIQQHVERPRAAAVVPPPPPPASHVPVPVPVSRRTIPMITGAGAVVTLGAGILGLALRESTIARYNATCRGFGDPNPTAACNQMSYSASASGATALAATGFVTGGVLGIVTAILFAMPTHSHRLAFRCGGGPGDIGISCGGTL